MRRDDWSYAIKGGNYFDTNYSYYNRCSNNKYYKSKFNNNEINNNKNLAEFNYFNYENLLNKSFALRNDNVFNNFDNSKLIEGNGEILIKSNDVDNDTMFKSSNFKREKLNKINYVDKGNGIVRENQLNKDKIDKPCTNRFTNEKKKSKNNNDMIVENKILNSELENVNKSIDRNSDEIFSGNCEMLTKFEKWHDSFKIDDNMSKNIPIMTIDEIKKEAEIVYNVMQGRPSLKINLNQCWLDCLLDTGARVNVIDGKMLKNMKDVKIEMTNERLRAANDSVIKTLGKAILETEINGCTKWIEFIVVDKLSPSVIGGIDLQKKFNIKLKIEPVEVEQINYQVCEIIANFGKEVTDDQRFEKAINIFKIDKKSELYGIISKNKAAFMIDSWDIGCTNLIKHSIITEGGPILIKPRRQPVNLENKINDAIQNLYENKIIRKCNSPWNTPLVCVWKKDKKDIRLCLDFRQLNKITVRQAFPMPNVEELLDTLHGARYFSSIDLGNAYYQVELDEESQVKTAFSTKLGQFCFTRMPFGIAAAPGTFQELMNKVLIGINGVEALVYLDDILVFSKSMEEHMTRLNNVLSRIQTAGLRINPEKCSLLKKEVKFLGHIITSEGIRTDHSKVEAIDKFERPKCIKNLRSFLGLCNYYRRFINKYAEKARILEALCGKGNEKLVWSDQCEESFNQLKSALQETPVLAYPDFNKVFILDTDASFDAIGAVLSQLDEYGNERVIAYGSHAMNSHERGYCITRKELLAIYYFTQHFNHYLYGKQFILRTDHKAITFMLSTKKPITSQFQTWINFLSSLDIKMEYRKGNLHVNADSLSRQACTTCSQCQMIHSEAKSGKLKTRILTLMTDNAGKEWQDGVQEIEVIKDQIRIMKGGYFQLIDDIVKTKDNKIWIPESKRAEFIRKTHFILCHAGCEKVKSYIKNNFDMENLSNFVKEIIDGCEACQKQKIITTRTKEKLIPETSSRPFENIYMDVCGPLRSTWHQEKYILAIIDHFSKYISLTAIAKQDENTITDTLVKKWILKFGAPRKIHLDCGKSFESKMMKELANKYDIQVIYSSPYHHSANGLIERQFRTIRDRINTSIKTNKNKNWADLIPEIEFSINASTQKTTKKSPAEIIFGFKINRTEWHETDKLQDKDVIKEKINNENRNSSVNQLSSRTFAVGDRVLIKKENRHKDEERYDGPFLITKRIHERSYEVTDMKGKKLIRNIEWIKGFKEGGY